PARSNIDTARLIPPPTRNRRTDASSTVCLDTSTRTDHVCTETHRDHSARGRNHRRRPRAERPFSTQSRNSSQRFSLWLFLWSFETVALCAQISKRRVACQTFASAPYPP